MKRTGLNLMSLLFTVIMAGAFTACLMAQSVPIGINYQAVARDASGNELINRNIDVRLSIISGSPAGEIEWEEVHSEVTTSQFGLFNIIIGQGIYSNGTVTSFEDIPWGDDLFFLKVEIKFDSEYLTMGTMQFLSVPYALYAQKSLEPGPQGPPGPAGDPATDDQVLSYDHQNHILSLTNDENPVNLSGLINDADADPDNELQILNLSGNKLQIKTLSDSTLINTVDIDASPVNEIQDLRIEGNELYITRNSDSTRIDLSPYLDNTDEQDLSLSDNLLTIENGNTVALNYNDISATNELQVLSISNDTIYLTDGGYVKLPQDNVDDADPYPGNELITGGVLNGSNLEITDAGGTTTVNLSSLENIPLIGFRAVKNITTNHTSIPDSLFLIFEDEIYDYGEMYDKTTGEFTSPEEGVYSFVINYNADERQVIKLYINSTYFDTYYGNEVNSFSGYITSNILVYLNAGDVLRLKIYIYGYDTDCGKGSITGFRIH